MDSIQEQVGTLTHKVDALHQMLDQVNLQVAQILTQHNTVTDSGHSSESITLSEEMIGSTRSALDGVMEHKDILLDNLDYMAVERHNSEQNISPEIQIQRLTAQLTAAYNRIAALEEQLLASRNH